MLFVLSLQFILKYKHFIYFSAGRQRSRHQSTSLHLRFWPAVPERSVPGEGATAAATRAAPGVLLGGGGGVYVCDFNRVLQHGGHWGVFGGIHQRFGIKFILKNLDLCLQAVYWNHVSVLTDNGPKISEF